VLEVPTFEKMKGELRTKNTTMLAENEMCGFLVTNQQMKPDHGMKVKKSFIFVFHSKFGFIRINTPVFKCQNCGQRKNFPERIFFLDLKNIFVPKNLSTKIAKNEAKGL